MSQVSLRGQFGQPVAVLTDDITSVYVEKGFALGDIDSDGKIIQKPEKYLYTHRTFAGISVHLKDGRTFGTRSGISALLKEIAEAGRDLSSVTVVTPEVFLSNKNEPRKGYGVRDGEQFSRYLQVQIQAIQDFRKQQVANATP